LKEGSKSISQRIRVESEESESESGETYARPLIFLTLPGSTKFNVFTFLTTGHLNTTSPPPPLTSPPTLTTGPPLFRICSSSPSSGANSCIVGSKNVLIRSTPRSRESVVMPVRRMESSRLPQMPRATRGSRK
jgi:hypothetical protein